MTSLLKFMIIIIIKLCGLLTERREDQPVDDSLTVGAGTGPRDVKFSELSDDERKGIHNHKAVEVGTFLPSVHLSLFKVNF